MLRYKWRRANKKKILLWSSVILIFAMTVGTIARFYAAIFTSLDGLTANITEDAVYVNDLEADWNYYEGLNYTEVTNKSNLPSYDDRVASGNIIYGKDTLVAVQLTYDGRDVNDPNLIGRVSSKSTETQYQYVYYKYYPIENGKIKIELIDNPYTMRPEGKGFNGWTCNPNNDSNEDNIINCTDITFSYDNNYYVRYITINANKALVDENGNKKMIINLNASWIDADIRDSFPSSSNQFNDKGMQSVEWEPSNGDNIYGTIPIYSDVYSASDTFKSNTRIYKKESKTVGNNIFASGTINVGHYANSSHTDTTTDLTYYSSYNCGRGKTCYYYVSQAGKTVNSGDTYYLLNEAGNAVTTILGRDISDEEFVPVVSGQEIAGYETAQFGNTLVFNNSAIMIGYYYYVSGNHSNDSKYYDNTGNVCRSSNCNSGAYKLIQPTDSKSNLSFEYVTITTNNINDYINIDGYSVNNNLCIVNSSNNPVMNGEECYKLYDADGHNFGIEEGTNNLYFLDENENPKYDGEGNIIYLKSVILDRNYHYLVTRDTNIVSISSGTISTSSIGLNQPYTLTGNYMGERGSASISISSNKISLSDDLVIENINYSGASLSNSNISSTTIDKTRNVIDSNDYNLKIGRGLNGSTFFGKTVVGGINNRIIVESGYYQNIIVSDSESTLDSHTESILGSDYDRVSSENDKLRVYYRVTGNENLASGSRTSSSVLPYTDMLVKSGTYGYYIFSSRSASASMIYLYGLYVGCPQDTYYSAVKRLKVEGGKVFNIIGGLLKNTTTDIVASIYVTGGHIENIVGGAGIDWTYGSRVVSVTGGVVSNAVAGGSNSYSATSSKYGELKGSTLVYIGGNATIGDTLEVSESSGNLYNVEVHGSVFGAGLGKSNIKQSGEVYNSNVIINGGTINGDVYGGGNFGSVGSLNATESSMDIKLLNGTINGSVFGGSNNSSNGYNVSNPTSASDFLQNITITLDGSKKQSEDIIIRGSIYGGSNSSGTIYGNVTINLINGTGNSDNMGVYGGGYGADTSVLGNINISSNQDNPNKLRIKDIYGGSENGTVNGTSLTNVTGSISININGGTFTNIYGGGKGTTDAPNTYGNIDLIVNKGIINYVFGGNNFLGTLKQTDDELKITINGGEINTIFGGSNGAGASATDTNVIINGGIIKDGVYGGGNAAETLGTTHITINGGTYYTLDESNKITLDNDGNAIAANVYGGGVSASVNTSIVTINNGANLYDVFGGGYEAGANESNVTLSGGNVYNIYGGSNRSGLVNETNVNSNSGTIACNTYGGGLLAPVGTSNNNINGATFTYQLADEENIYSPLNTCGNAFGGGDQSDAENTNVTLNSGSLLNIYGGSNLSGTVENTHVVIVNGTVSMIYGGNNEGGKSNSTLIEIEPSDTGNIKISNVFGGGKGSLAESGKTNVKIKGKINNTTNTNRLTLNKICGGGYESRTIEYTKLYLQEITVDEIYGGGYRGQVTGDKTSENPYLSEDIHAETYVNLIKNVTANNIYGGGYFANIGDAKYDGDNVYQEDNNYHSVTSNTYVNILNGTVEGNVYGSGNASFVYGDTHVNLGTNAINNIERQIGKADSESYENDFIDEVEEAKLYQLITIKGSVFGGSETNASESTVYTDTFKGVVGNTYVNVSADAYDGLCNINFNDSNECTSDITVIVNKSIFGGGNNSGVTGGNSYVLINKVGTTDNPAHMISVQRADYAYIVDSVLELTGATDRAYSTSTKYSLIRLNNLYLINNILDEQTYGTTLYLKNSSTYLSNYFSGGGEVDIQNTRVVSFEQETISDKDGTNKQPDNADNSIYVYEKKPPLSFNIVTGEVPSIDNDISNGGPVYGMTFFGQYYKEDEVIKTSVYNRKYSGGEIYEDELAGHQNSYSYVFGIHDITSDPEVNGFFTNYYSDKTGLIKVDYIMPTPENGPYYKWEIGSDVFNIIVNMEANQYSQRTTVNATINLDNIEDEDGNPVPNYWNDSRLRINDIDTSHFYASDEEYEREIKATLVDRSEIPTLAKPVSIEDKNHDGVIDSNNYFALSMGTTTSGWYSNYRTDFYNTFSRPDQVNICNNKTSGKCTGSNEYIYDSSTDNRILSFWLYYSENIDLSMATTGTESEEDEEDEDGIRSIKMGYVLITTTLEKYNEDQTFSSYSMPVYIYVYISLTEGDTDSYGAMISPGKKYDIFQNQKASIPENGSFSIYQKLSLDLNNNVAGTNIPWDVADLYNNQPYLEKESTNAGSTDIQYWGPTYRYLVTDYNLPVGTRITMLDLVTNEEYFYEVETLSEPQSQYKYYLRDFSRMGYSELYRGDGTRKEYLFYDEDIKGANSTKYYDSETNFVTEEYIFIVDLNGAEIENVPSLQSEGEETHYMFLKMARQVYSSQDDTDPIESDIIIPRGTPTTELVFTLNRNNSSRLETVGYLFDEYTEGEKEENKYYDNTDNLLVKFNTKLIQENVSSSMINTKFDDYSLGAKISIERLARDNQNNPISNGDGTYKYEVVTHELNGLVVTAKGQTYYPLSDYSIKMLLSRRISEVGALIKIDLSKTDLPFGTYRLAIDTFLSYDGVYFDEDSIRDTIYIDFILLDSKYGLSISTSPESITHDVETGKDVTNSSEIRYNINVKNGLNNPNLKITLQRRVYNEDNDFESVYNTEYENIDISDLFEEIELIDEDNDIRSGDVFNSCLHDNDEEIATSTGNQNICPSQIYTLGDIDRSKISDEEDNMLNYTLRVKLKNGPTESDKVNQIQAKWKSGTYRIVISLYDDVMSGENYIKTNCISKVYEYLVIR